MREEYEIMNKLFDSEKWSQQSIIRESRILQRGVIAQNAPDPYHAREGIEEKIRIIEELMWGQKFQELE